MIPSKIHVLLLWNEGLMFFYLYKLLCICNHQLLLDMLNLSLYLFVTSKNLIVISLASSNNTSDQHLLPYRAQRVSFELLNSKYCCMQTLLSANVSPIYHRNLGHILSRPLVFEWPILTLAWGWNPIWQHNWIPNAFYWLLQNLDMNRGSASNMMLTSMQSYNLCAVEIC